MILNNEIRNCDLAVFEVRTLITVSIRKWHDNNVKIKDVAFITVSGQSN